MSILTVEPDNLNRPALEVDKWIHTVQNWRRNLCVYSATCIFTEVLYPAVSILFKIIGCTGAYSRDFQKKYFDTEACYEMVTLHTYRETLH
jgi:choline-glycine betaine transporter